MKLICGPADFVANAGDGAIGVVLYGQPKTSTQASAGQAARTEIRRYGLVVAPRAWDFVSIALSVVAADHAVQRTDSPDGWTREIELVIAVADPDFWNGQRAALAEALSFLTTDRWKLEFRPNGDVAPQAATPHVGKEQGVVLVSGGLDSLVGAIDLAANDPRLLAVSQVVRGDAQKQMEFARRIGGGLRHVQLTHATQVPGGSEASQRSRSIVFVAFAVAAATSLMRHRDGARVPLYLCENGFIAINPPLTGSRLGSLSTRTAHPIYLHRIQRLLDAADLRVDIVNPYAEKTKGEMLRECADQVMLKRFATKSTSCGRYLRFGYKHCGRCVPCQVRRAALSAWGKRADSTVYVYADLGKGDAEHAYFDDVRSMSIALRSVDEKGLEAWIGHALASSNISNRPALMAMLGRGLNEVRALHKKLKVK